MPYWINALLFAILVVTIPFSLILRILLQLPKANALSNRKWPSALNLVLIGLITGYVTVFIRSAYYVRTNSPAVILIQFAIACLAYGFGLVLILRQFVGLYPEFLVTTGSAGLGIRKIAYRNIEDFEEVWKGHGETRLRLFTVHGTSFLLSIPSASMTTFRE